MLHTIYEGSTYKVSEQRSPYADAKDSCSHERVAEPESFGSCETCLFASGLW
jgi:hypothetical protein